jgi:hypothetical protein
MNKFYVSVIAVMVAAVLLAGCAQEQPQGNKTPTNGTGDNITTPSAEELACTTSGGTVQTSECCLSSGDFPNMCMIGACGCSLENSHNVKKCICGEGKCWNGTTCAPSTVSPPDNLCTQTGGTMKTASCCKSVEGMPNTCMIGACGCSPENSHEITACECPEGQCYDTTSGCVGVVDPLEELCTSTGGTVSTSTCCLSVGDFPDSCAIGACGCSPDNSHEVKACSCGSGKCFNSESGCIASHRMSD